MPSAGSAINLALTLFVLTTLWLAIRDVASRQLAPEALIKCPTANKSETICVLRTEADKYLEWTWFEREEPLEPAVELSASGSSELILDGVLRLGLGKSAFALDLSKLRATIKRVHKAKVFLPFYPITSNEGCEFSLSYRVNQRSQYVISTMGAAKESKNKWPKVSVVLIRPKSGDPHGSAHESASLADVHLLNYFEHPGNYLANEFELSMLIGRQLAGSWSLAILVETRLDADFIEFARMKLTNCKPTGGEMAAFAANNNLRELIDLEHAFATTCNKTHEEFQCRLSGRCLSLELRCDFGHDCGSLDDSDEFRCSADYEGRCDFETDSDLCEWAALPRGAGNSWTWSSVADSSLIDHKPPLDHTLQTPGDGHYLLLGVHQLDNKQNKQLIGPKVQLKAGHPDCKFRFWLHVPGSLRSTSLKSSLLRVGYEHIEPADLFGEAGGKEHREENNWRRFQVTLLEGHLMHHDVTPPALHIQFTNFSNDLELLALSDAYLALDDFSFSPGCALTFYNKPPANICGDTEFECDFAPPKAPKQFCLPSNRVCDFKNDCGLYSELSTSGWSLSAASDEAHCMSWFNVERSGSFVGLELSGLQVVNHMSERGENLSNLSAGLEVNEALELELPQLDPAQAHKLSPFKFSAQYERFMRNYHDQSRQMQHVTEAGILLPRFHQAHANCRLRLTYAWDENSRNLVASIYMIRAGVSTLFKRWSCGKDLANERMDKLGVSLGLGEQNSPFSVQLRVSVESLEMLANNSSGDQFSGSFSLMSYTFENCAHQAGQVSVPQAQMVPIGDNDDDAEYEDEFQRESIEVANEAADELLFHCPEGQFQCQRPILCLDERFVCDKQRDCQESGADEVDCAAKGFILYDFEDYDQLKGWSPALQAVGVEPEANTLVWSVEDSIEFGSTGSDTESSPPVDHTIGRASGHFLSLRYHGDDALADGSRAASIETPTFRVLETCKRLVLYIYETSKNGSATLSFSIIYSNPTEGISSDEIKLQPDGTPVSEKVDGWRRFQFGLPHATDCQECRKASVFSINMYASRDSQLGSSSETLMLALDDIILGPKCHPYEGQSNHNHSHASEATTNISSAWLWYKLVGFSLLAVAICSIGLLIFVSRSRRLAPVERPDRQGENYFPLGRLS